MARSSEAVCGTTPRNLGRGYDGSQVTLPGAAGRRGAEGSVAVVTGRPSCLALVDGTSSVAEAIGGAARHRSVGAPAVVAGCRRLRFGLGASRMSAAKQAREAGPSLGRPRSLNSGQGRRTMTTRRTSPLSLNSKNPAHQDPRQDPGQEEVGPPQSAPVLLLLGRAGADWRFGSALA